MRVRRSHDGTITVTVPDTLWATDATEGWSVAAGRCAIFAIVDHGPIRRGVAGRRPADGSLGRR